MRKGESINGGAATAYMRAVTRAEACLLASVLQAASPQGINFFSAVVTSVFTGQDSVFNTKSCVAASFRFPVASARLALAYKDPQGRNTISSQRVLFTGHCDTRDPTHQNISSTLQWPRRTP